MLIVESGVKAKPTTIAAIVLGIEEDIADRQGLGDVLDIIPDDVRREIRFAWAEIVRKALREEK